MGRGGMEAVQKAKVRCEANEKTDTHVADPHVPFRDHTNALLHTKNIARAVRTLPIEFPAQRPMCYDHGASQGDAEFELR